MVRDYFRRSVRRRLTLMTLLTVLSALALAASAFFINDAFSTRSAITEELRTLAQVVGANSTAALSFGDRRTAQENLSALVANPDIGFAGLFSAQGTLIASYVDSDVSRDQKLRKLQRAYRDWRENGQPERRSRAYREYWSEVEVALPVLLDGKQIGTIIVEAGLQRLYDRMFSGLAISVAVVAATLLIGLLISARLQQTISGPVLELARVMSTVTAKEAYGTRVHTSARDEIGTLFSAFNQMLEQIGVRDQRLALMSERLNLALDASGIGLWDFNVLSGSVYLDARWSGMIGARAGETSTSIDALKKLLPADERERVVASALLALKGKQPLHDVEHRVRTCAGDWIWLHSRGKVTERNAEGRALRMIGINMDVTLRKQAEADLRSAKDAAEQANRAKSQFLANMSHEIRTPMNGMLGMTELLLNTALDGQQRRLVETARQSGTALLGIINHILDFSKIEAGKLEMEHIDFDLRGILGEAVDLFGQSARAKSVALILQVDDAVPRKLRGDPGRLRQILTNLIDNSIKFTDHGTVLVHAQLAHGGGVPAMLRVEVSDTGIGVEADALARIFDAFSQADGSTTRRFGGTGLGLTISKELVALFGGEIGVSSNPGTGSTFWFTIPIETPGEAGASRPERPGSASSAPAHKPGAGALRVLVAEDNPINQIVAVEMLRSLGHDCCLAGNGSEALAAIAHDRFDLVLMDCQMPEMDGLEATRVLRRREAAAGSPRLPVIAVTAHAMAGDKEQCTAAGMDGYLAKPYDRPQLEAAIRRQLESLPLEAAPPSAAPAHAAAAPSDRVALDRAALDNIRALDKSGGDAVLRRVIAIFLKNAPKLVQAMRRAADGNDAAELGRTAHSLKSSSLSVGAVRLGDICREIETAARGGTPAPTPALVASVESEYLRVERLLEQELKNGPA